MTSFGNPRYLKELRAAHRAAREAGRFLMAKFEKRNSLAVETKAGEAVNYVTRVDRESEKR
ncbi:MAG: hypothetical protein HY760_08625, partial [Nitrospirae bacterium]|nr:hypothetical protein [Nitrospirota bacterium]